MKLIWTPEALQDRRDIWDYIAQDSEVAAARMDALFSEAASRFIDYPLLGRPGLLRSWPYYTLARNIHSLSVSIRRNYRDAC